MKNFLNTALPRVGVARPNGSYVARTQVLAARATLVRRRTLADARRAYRTSTPRTRVTEGETLAVSLAAYLYAVAKFYIRAFKRTGDTCSSTSRHRIVDLASGISGYTPLLWENEN